MNLTERGLQALEQALAGLGEGHAAGRAMEQTDPQALFQRADRIADRRGGQGQFGPRTAEAAVPRHGGERGQVGEVVSDHDYPV